MATDTIEFEATPGLTLTFDVYPEGSDTASFSGVSATERTNAKGTYRGTVSAPTAGNYKVHVKVGSDVVGVYWVVLANDGADHYCGDRIVTSAPEVRNEFAKSLLKLDWTGLTGEAARSCLNAFRFLRNKWSVSGGTLTVTKEDDATSAWTASVTTDAGADPITGSDPA